MRARHRHDRPPRLDWLPRSRACWPRLCRVRLPPLRADAVGGVKRACDPDAASRQGVDAAAHALGRSRSPGQLHEQVRAGHAVRAPGRIRRATIRRHQGRRADRHPAGAAGSSAAEHHAHRRRSRRQLGGPLQWQDQFEVNKGSRPWFVVDPPDGKIPPHDAGGAATASRPCGGRAREPRQRRRFVRPIGASTTAASRAGCPAR